jgi:flagellar basal body-associated protein FliL
MALRSSQFDLSLPTQILIIIIIIIIIITTTTIIIIMSPFRKYLSNIRESTKSKNYRKQPYWAQHTHFGMY